MTDPLRERARIIHNARRLRREIEQIFTDGAVWNDEFRQPDDAPINVDPIGELRRLATALDEMLAADRGHGPIPPIRFTRSQ